MQIFRGCYFETFSSANCRVTFRNHRIYFATCVSGPVTFIRRIMVISTYYEKEFIFFLPILNINHRLLGLVLVILLHRPQLKMSPTALFWLANPHFVSRDKRTSSQGILNLSVLLMFISSCSMYLVAVAPLHWGPVLTRKKTRLHSLMFKTRLPETFFLYIIPRLTRHIKINSPYYDLYLTLWSASVNRNSDTLPPKNYSLLKQIFFNLNPS